MSDLRVLCCRPNRDSAAADPTVSRTLQACGTRPIEWIGPRPGKEIDELLTDRLLVIGDDSDLAAVALRLLRRELLGKVIVAFATDRPTAVTDLYSLPLGAAAVRLAELGEPDVVPLVRNDVGGVMVGRAVISPVEGTAYLDENRILHGPAAGMFIDPHPSKGLEVTVVSRRFLMFGRRPRSYLGRAVQISTQPARVVSDEVTFDRSVTRWTYYKHTEPLRLVRGVA